MHYRGRGGTPGLLPGIPHLGPLTFPTTHSERFLDSQLVWELRKSESLHGQVVVEGGGTMYQPAANESASEQPVRFW